MPVTRARGVAISQAGTVSLTVDLGAPPAVGNLVTLAWMATINTSADMTIPAGFTPIASTPGATATGQIMAYRVADGTEGQTFTMSTTNSGTYFGRLDEWNSGRGPWPADTGDVSGVTINTANTTSTATAGGPVSSAQGWAYTSIGLSAAGTFSNTWTGGFAQMSATPRYTTASKQLVSLEVPSTTETWVTSTTSRHLLGVFKLPFLPPADLAATITGGGSGVDLTWTAVDGAVAYDLEGDGNIIVSDYSGTSYSDTGVKSNYRIRSVG
jgi:hypothetical protein